MRFYIIAVALLAFASVGCADGDGLTFQSARDLGLATALPGRLGDGETSREDASEFVERVCPNLHPELVGRWTGAAWGCRDRIESPLLRAAAANAPVPDTELAEAVVQADDGWDRLAQRLGVDRGALLAVNSQRFADRRTVGGFPTIHPGDRVLVPQ